MYARCLTLISVLLTYLSRMRGSGGGGGGGVMLCLVMDACEGGLVGEGAAELRASVHFCCWYSINFNFKFPLVFPLEDHIKPDLC